MSLTAKIVSSSDGVINASNFFVVEKIGDAYSFGEEMTIEGWGFDKLINPAFIFASANPITVIPTEITAKRIKLIIPNTVSTTYQNFYIYSNESISYTKQIYIRQPYITSVVCLRNNSNNVYFGDTVEIHGRNFPTSLIGYNSNPSIRVLINSNSGFTGTTIYQTITAITPTKITIQSFNINPALSVTWYVGIASQEWNGGILSWSPQIFPVSNGLVYTAVLAPTKQHPTIVFPNGYLVYTQTNAFDIDMSKILVNIGGSLCTNVYSNNDMVVSKIPAGVTLGASTPTVSVRGGTLFTDASHSVVTLNESGYGSGELGNLFVSGSTFLGLDASYQYEHIMILPNGFLSSDHANGQVMHLQARGNFINLGNINLVGIGTIGTQSPVYLDGQSYVRTVTNPATGRGGVHFTVKANNIYQSTTSIVNTSASGVGGVAGVQTYIKRTTGTETQSGQRITNNT